MRFPEYPGPERWLTAIGGASHDLARRAGLSTELVLRVATLDAWSSDQRGYVGGSAEAIASATGLSSRAVRLARLAMIDARLMSLEVVGPFAAPARRLHLA